LVNILIISHSQLAKGLLSAAIMIMGDQDGVCYLGLEPAQGFEEFKNLVEEKINFLQNDDGVLILADLYGGSPCNIAVILCAVKKVSPLKTLACISGVNLPMLIEALCMRGTMSLEELTQHCLNSGKIGVKDAAKVMLNK